MQTRSKVWFGSDEVHAREVHLGGCGRLAVHCDTRGDVQRVFIWACEVLLDHSCGKNKTCTFRWIPGPCEMFAQVKLSPGGEVQRAVIDPSDRCHVHDNHWASECVVPEMHVEEVIGVICKGLSNSTSHACP